MADLCIGSDNIVHYTVDREYFVVNILSDSLACAKIKHANICTSLTIMWYRVVCPKIIYLLRGIFWTQNLHDLR